MAEKRSFSRTVFPIKNLYFAVLSEGEPLNQIFPNVSLIVCRYHGNINDQGTTKYWERYQEIFLDSVVAERTATAPNSFYGIPKPLKTLRLISWKYFTPEERELGYVSDIRLFNVFQQINAEKHEKSFVKQKNNK